MKNSIIILLVISILYSLFTFCIIADGRLFTDVEADAWYAPYVADCVEKGLMIGTSDTEFSPDSTVTRAMFIQSLYKYYQNKIQGTDNDLNHLGIKFGYVGGHVTPITEIDGTKPFTIEQVLTIQTDLNDPSTKKDVTYHTTREELLSGITHGFISDVTQNEGGIIEFSSEETLTLLPDSPDDRCKIYMHGGSCVGSGFSGYAERVTVRTDKAKVEAKTKSGAEFKITLCDLASRTGVIVRGKSTGSLDAELYGYDLTLKGAEGPYEVEVYKWVWDFSEQALKKYTCPAGIEKSNAIPFGDVKDGAYYTEALKWAAMLKIIAGVSQTEFCPNAPITREQISTILHKFLFLYYDIDYYKLMQNNFDFADKADISDYAAEAVDRIASAGIMKGDENGRFNPKAPTKRCEAATVFSDMSKLFT